MGLGKAAVGGFVWAAGGYGADGIISVRLRGYWRLWCGWHHLGTFSGPASGYGADRAIAGLCEPSYPLQSGLMTTTDLSRA